MRCMDIAEQAATLLLRSPNLSISAVLELLEIGDGEFRQMVAGNERLAKLLDDRRAGRLRALPKDLRICPTCHEWYLPYGGARYCSDVCASTARVAQTPTVKRAR